MRTAVHHKLSDSYLLPDRVGVVQEAHKMIKILN